MPENPKSAVQQIQHGGEAPSGIEPASGPESSPQPEHRAPRPNLALRVALLYGAFAGLWIVCSDSVLMGLSSDKHLILELSVLKGWLFVVVSGGLLYVILNRQFRRLDREVAELSRTRAEARANERRFISLFENMPNGVARCRIVYEGGIPVDFVYLTVNRAFVRLTGLRDVEGKRVSEVIPGLLESDPRLLERYARTAATGEPTSFEVFVSTLGQWYFVSAYQPAPGEFVSVFDAVTERKRTEKSLRLLSRAVEQSAVSILITDSVGSIEYVNAKFTEQSGYLQAEVIGKNPKIFQSGSTPREVYQQMWDTIVGGDQWRGEIQNRKKNGELVWERVTIFPVTEEGVGIAHFVAVKEDITERKKMQEQILRSQRVESLGMLAAGIAHDLNNVLAPISMALPLLRSNASSADDLEMFTMVERSSKRGAALVQQILGFARGVGGEVRAVQVKHLLNDVLSIAFETFPKSIVIESQVPNDLWPIKANPTQIHQVLLNLCVNARDAMPNGGTMRVSAENRLLDAQAARAIEGARPGAWLVIHVADTGQGIGPEILARIWEPFFTTKETQKGTGLGLSTVQGIVKTHMGFVGVTTQVGRGTIFHVYLPSTAEAVNAEEKGAKAGPENGSNELILFVDDEEPIRMAASSILTNSGYRVLSASNGSEALKLLETCAHDVALVITDLDMPNVGGEMLSVAIRALKPGLKIITMSGLGSHSAQERAGQFSDAFMQKPFTAERLLNLVQEFKLKAPPIS